MLEGATLQFLGGTGTVTGSKHLVTLNGAQLLLDCGLFQGLKELRRRNWQPFSFDPTALTAVVLSHAHIDHSGALPLLVRRGFHGPIHCTAGTASLLRVMLLDAAHLQEEEAEFANRHGYSKHKPARPLYTTADAEAALGRVEAHGYGETFGVADGVMVTFRRAAHILGSATVDLQLGGSQGLRLVFSGDLGRWNRPILRDPDPVDGADALLVESTYGDRTHAPDPAEALAKVSRDAAARGGALIVPAFAVGRAQELIWTIRRLEDEDKIPSLPVFIDSPMAINVTDIYCRHPEDHDLDMTTLMDEKRCPLCCKQYHLVRTATESKALNDRHGPMIVISASGMATGGRVVHHLKERLPDERTTVLLPGFQAAGTRGRQLHDAPARFASTDNRSMSVPTWSRWTGSPRTATETRSSAGCRRFGTHRAGRSSSTANHRHPGASRSFFAPGSAGRSASRTTGRRSRSGREGDGYVFEHAPRAWRPRQRT